MNGTRFYFPTELTVGCGCREQYPEIARRYGKRVLLMTGKSSMRKAGTLKQFLRTGSKNGLTIALQEGISMNPLASDADRFAKKAKKIAPDVIVGLGGGSVIDMVKAVALLVRRKGTARTYMNLPGRPAKPITSAVCPFIAVPTTSGSGSEATPFAVLTDDETGLKKGMSSPFLYPKAALLDPEITALMPADLTALSGFDAFSQAFEGYTSRKSTMISDSFARESLRHIIGNLKRAVSNPKDLRAREKMSWGASLSGLCIGMVDVNLAHAMSHPLSSRYDLHHGLAVAQCIIPVIAFNAKYLITKYREIVSIFQGQCTDYGSKRQGNLKGIVSAWMDALRIKRGLKNYVNKEPDIPQLANDALEIGAIRSNIRKVTRCDLEKLYRMAWNGKGL
ncbi:MAG: iron-containing alcohol dehydrogenase [Candidatus Omnitrophota bacterium]